MATLSRFCVFWIRKTIRKVMMVVPVLMTSCQVSLNRNSGPVTAHTRMMSRAIPNVAGWPAPRAVPLANLVNASAIVMAAYIAPAPPDRCALPHGR